MQRQVVMMNSNPKLATPTIRFENCQVLFENQCVEKNSPPAVSDTSETSIVSSDDCSLCADTLRKHSSQGHSVEDSDRNQRKRTVSDIGEEQPLRLLSQPCEDKIALHPLHAFIRQQIEVFTVERADMEQRAPGRKNPIRLHQVGLRCIHCRSLPHRAKRAVCYPTSVARVYHAVSDMKFDHFSRCAGLPESVRAKLNELREDQKSPKEPSKKKKKSFQKAAFISTAQYYHDAAVLMGMTDRDGGVYMNNQLLRLREVDRESSLGAATSHTKSNGLQNGNPPRKRAKIASFPPRTLCDAAVSKLLLRHQLNASLNTKNTIINERPRMMPTLSPPIQARVNLEEDKARTAQVKLPLQSRHRVHEINPHAASPPPRLVRTPGTILLSSPRDEQYLNDIHCFIRKQVEVFAAEPTDVDAPAPGRRQRILLGQVGIRCIHCASLPAQHRLKRAVCYPPSKKGIYHAVSNMKFDHFTVCQCLPTDVKARFEQLYSSEKRKSTRARTTKGSRSSSMGQFYMESASALGLADTETGIRFPSSQPAVPATKLHDLTGMSALLIAATDPNIRLAYFQEKNTRLMKTTQK